MNAPLTTLIVLRLPTNAERTAIRSFGRQTAADEGCEANVRHGLPPFFCFHSSSVLDFGSWTKDKPGCESVGQMMSYPICVVAREKQQLLRLVHAAEEGSRKDKDLYDSDERNCGFF